MSDLLRGVLERPRKRRRDYSTMPAGLDQGQQYQWERGCHLKRRFATREEALLCSIGVWLQKGDAGQGVYRCEFCGAYHLGHSERER